MVINWFGSRKKRKGPKSWELSHGSPGVTEEERESFRNVVVVDFGAKRDSQFSILREYLNSLKRQLKRERGKK